ncbi:26S proteasome non-ATPase regulatory subunit 9 [Phlebotomus papatasi]|uniref:26S proteasome non-ATPase regulatory subunit 9 n=1 Tax=Phlebotomus papatasi TaxID=29031 RepID=A0A1B0D735_PHLPP|nr:26S proteasome non-ATPase regulatory subunit 9 [Phlebotomus papatasi]
MVVPSGNSMKKEEVLKLMEEKAKLERKLADLNQILEANNVGMEDPLVDADGFPRSDIDVYQVRIARQQIICTRNDLKGLMGQIEQGLEHYFAEQRANGAAGTSSGTSTTTKLANYTENGGISVVSARETPSAQTPICKVNLVATGGPAEQAGFRVGDEVIEFGSLNASNFRELTQIADIVKNQQDSVIKVKIRRQNRLLPLDLIPRVWSGRGLLGCNVIPADSIER